jgi:hypothetical protein
MKRKRKRCENYGGYSLYTAGARRCRAELVAHMFSNGASQLSLICNDHQFWLQSKCKRTKWD